MLEAAARKPGNVHPTNSFIDLTYQDFVASAECVAPILARTLELGVGRAILEAVTATQANVGRNTNLGIVLLLAPLAAVPPDVRLADGIAGVLGGLTRQDAELVYKAIALAHPGGMGRVEDQDLGAAPTQTLLEVMRLAAGRDAIARQYAENFSAILEFGLPYLNAVDDFAQNWEAAIIGLQLELIARHGDSLILRKCGAEIAGEAARRANAILQAAPAGDRFAPDELDQFDRWLRADGNRRNPGTTADLIATSLFAAMRDGKVPAMRPPPRFENEQQNTETEN